MKKELRLPWFKINTETQNQEEMKMSKNPIKNSKEEPSQTLTKLYYTVRI